MKSLVSAAVALALAVAVGGALLLSRPSAPKPASLVGAVTPPTPSPTLVPTPTEVATVSPSATDSPAPSPTMDETGPQQSPPPLASWSGPANVTATGVQTTTGGPPHTPVFTVSGTSLQVCWTIGTGPWSGVEVDSWPIPPDGFPAFHQEVSVGRATGCQAIDVAPGKYVVRVTSATDWTISVTPS